MIVIESAEFKALKKKLPHEDLQAFGRAKKPVMKERDFTYEPSAFNYGSASGLVRQDRPRKFYK